MARGTNPIPEMTESDIARFWSKVDKSPGQGPGGDCWEWTAGKNTSGYGHMWVGQKTYMAHRLATKVMGWSVPVGLYVLHRCDNRACVNPAHLWIGTYADNIRDRDEKGRHVACGGDAHGSRTKPWRTARGERAGMSKLTKWQVVEIRGMYAAGGVSQQWLAEEYGVCRSAIGHIVTRKTWKHILPQIDNSTINVDTWRNLWPK